MTHAVHVVLLLSAKPVLQEMTHSDPTTPLLVVIVAHDWHWRLVVAVQAALVYCPAAQDVAHGRHLASEVGVHAWRYVPAAHWGAEQDVQTPPLDM